MSYIAVWLFQVLGMFVWMRWLSTSPMSFHEFTAGAYFSAVALFAHWFSNLFRTKCSGWCGKCLYGCVMNLPGKERK